jgi:hypothetical protein
MAKDKPIFDFDNAAVRQMWKRKHHGMTKTPEHRAWTNMLSRCLNPNHPKYAGWGGRGIKVCDAWQASFMAFYADVGPRPAEGYSIDRRDNDGHYEPGNVRWVKRIVQQQNTRQNVFLTSNGETLCLREWSRRVGVCHNTIARRMAEGLSPAECLASKRKVPAAKRKLSAEDVAAIRIAVASGEMVTHIARRFSVAHGTIRHIRDGQTWRWQEADHA